MTEYISIFSILLLMLVDSFSFAKGGELENLSGNIFYWQRDRDRDVYDDNDVHTPLADQLDHVTLNVNLDYLKELQNTGFIFDVGVFAAQDLNTGTNGGYGEFNFYPDSPSPYDPDWSTPHPLPRPPSSSSSAPRPRNSRPSVVHCWLKFALMLVLLS